MSWRLGNSIRLIYQTILQLWRNYVIAGIEIGLRRTIKILNIEISARESRCVRMEAT